MDAKGCRDDERAGLQALLRGANEACALLPPASPYVRSAEVLRQGLILKLEGSLDRHRRRSPRRLPEEA